ncbi:RNA polymerase sigma factor [Rheinheimera mesophila]|uniref:RNA polymerase sigma factor n=1 Tax=Rheinheimera mesophila TaxID=1547515 RepID=A0A3P3QJ48_9GAMM|nr:RNA polymerase sigma factor [Rheinheimera mesophila]KKL01838.1 RNA polymerase sigma 70 [Rheinheimera mesophila]RRJ21206.1 RNA polymerase sigma factor [Rheinheimera mesophila]
MKTELKTLLPQLRRFAFSLTGSAQDADDLVQNTIERLLNHPPEPHVTLLHWCFRVCRNVWIDEYRSRKVRQASSDEPELQEASTDGEATMLAQIQLTQLQKAMSRLPDEQIEVLSLVAVQGCSYAEAAQILALPAGTIMSRLARARNALLQSVRLSEGSYGV